jgi:alpha-ribazole phosphatase
MSATTAPGITPFYFVRHAPVVKDIGCLPAYDPPITDGPFWLDDLAKTLPKSADWHVSPLLRTRQTADLLRDKLLPHSERLDDALVEQSFGRWHGQKIEYVWNQIQQGPRHNWGFLMPDISPPDGDSFNDQMGRMAAWCEAVEQRRFARPQIIFTHAGTIRAVLAHMMGISPVKAQSIAIAHFGYLHASLMDADHAKDHHGGTWQLHALSPSGG